MSHRFHRYEVIVHKKILAAALLCAAASGACATNIVKNAGFEAGIADWEVSGHYRTQLSLQLAHGGTHAFITGCIGERCVDTLGEGSFFRQALPTVPGEAYDLSFWTISGAHEAQYAVYWDGALVDLESLLLPGTQMLSHEYGGLVATSPWTTLEIHGRDDAAFMAFDDVSVQPSVGLVPEPGSWAMLLAGLALGGWLVRRARRA